MPKVEPMPFGSLDDSAIGTMSPATSQSITGGFIQSPSDLAAAFSPTPQKYKVKGKSKAKGKNKRGENKGRKNSSKSKKAGGGRKHSTNNNNTSHAVMRSPARLSSSFTLGTGTTPLRFSPGFQRNMHSMSASKLPNPFSSLDMDMGVADSVMDAAANIHNIKGLSPFYKQSPGGGIGVEQGTDSRSVGTRSSRDCASQSHGNGLDDSVDAQAQDFFRTFGHLAEAASTPAKASQQVTVETA